MSDDLEPIQVRAWEEMAEIINVDKNDVIFCSRIKSARSRWDEYVDRPADLTPSAEMRENLKRVGDIAAELTMTLALVRNYLSVELLSHKNGYWDGVYGEGPFSDNQIDMLGKVSILATYAAEELTVQKGAKGDNPRRLAFIFATDIYEQYTNKRAACSKDKEGNASGPYIDFMLAFCRFCFPKNRHEAGSVEAFCSWLRETRAMDRDPLLRLVGLEVRKG